MKKLILKIILTYAIIIPILSRNPLLCERVLVPCWASVFINDDEKQGTVNLESGDSETNVVQSPDPGDVNGDGKVKLDDAIMLRRYVADWDMEIDIRAGDVNGDGKIKLDDAIILRRYVAGWDVELISPTSEKPPDSLQNKLPADLQTFEALTFEESETGIQKSSFCYGKSVQGRDLVGWSVSPKTWSRTILLNFEIHGWEDGYAADGQILVDLGEDVISHYAESADMYGCRLIIVPSCNPDGLAEGTTHNGFGRCNADGIDLNRDFDVDYQPYDNSRNYTPYAFSGKESTALRNLVLAVNPQVAIDFHGWENCTIGNSDVAEVFSLYCGLNHKKEFSSSAHGYFAYWAQEQGAEGLLVEFKDASSVNHEKVFEALDCLIQYDYGMHSLEETDPTYAGFYPIKTYARESGRLYTHQVIGDEGTSYGYIDGAGDQCDIIQIYKNGWCKVRYPVSSYTKTGYCSLNVFIEKQMKISPYQATVVSNTTVYTTMDKTTKLGSVWSTDVFTVVAEADDKVQIIYPLDTGGFKMGWIEASNLVKD